MILSFSSTHTSIYGILEDHTGDAIVRAHEVYRPILKSPLIPRLIAHHITRAAPDWKLLGASPLFIDLVEKSSEDVWTDHRHIFWFENARRGRGSWLWGRFFGRNQSAPPGIRSKIQGDIQIFCFASWVVTGSQDVIDLSSSFDLTRTCEQS